MRILNFEVTKRKLTEIELMGIPTMVYGLNEEGDKDPSDLIDYIQVSYVVDNDLWFDEIEIFPQSVQEFLEARGYNTNASKLEKAYTIEENHNMVILVFSLNNESEEVEIVLG